MDVVFATCEQQPLLTSDDQVLADALRARGVEVRPVPWTDLDPHTVVDAPPILLRSTWDYHRLPTMFGAWLAALEESGRVVWNPPAVARGNIDKIYLTHLEATGIAIPRTRTVTAVTNGAIERILDEERWQAAVIKPRIAATAYGTFRIERGSRLSDDELAPARASGALIQELVPEIISRGETSIVYCGRAFSHAVVKRAKKGDFRVQKDFGGRVDATDLTPHLAQFAGRVMAHVPDACLYARIDVVDTERGPLLMELELIEPELYFLIVPEAADTMAQLITSRLHP